MDKSADFYVEKYNKYLAKRTLNAICALIIFCRLLSYTASYFSPYAEGLLIKILSLITGKSTSLAIVLFSNISETAMWTYFTDMIYQFLFEFLPVLLFSKFVLKRNFEKNFPFEGKMMHPAITVYAFLTIMSHFAANAVIFVMDFLPSGAPYAPYSTPDPAAGLDFFVYFISVCVFTPFVEEYIYRGVIFGSLRRFGFGFAAFSSALIFMFSHVGFPTMAFAFVNGFFYALIIEKTGNIKTAVLLHALNNALNFAMVDILPMFFGTKTMNTVYFVDMIVLLVLAIPGAFILFFKKHKKPQEDVPETEGYAAAVKSKKNAGIFEILCLFMLLYGVLGVVRTLMLMGII
ncbi:MAG: CPBP family intramembrane metalloprotease [Clostridia bacterium]|nr:CPBP family intramembrane metalloprotease [Clostridia bacterium]